jgi:hypothetical protein
LLKHFVMHCAGLRPLHIRRSRPFFVLGVTLNAALMSLVVSGLGATPAAAANMKTETAFIPLQCNIGAGLSGGIPAHLGVTITATHLKSLNPGQKFRLRNLKPVLIDSPSAQRAAAVFHANAVEGVIRDFEQKLTNAKGNFNPGGTGTQINTVAAVQPPNVDAPPVGSATTSQSSPRDPLVDPNTAHPSPLDAWSEAGVPQGPPVPASDPRRHDEFSFGPIPIDTTASPGVNAYGPVPGTGGGATVTSGTPDPITVRPFKVTGLAGQNVVFDVGDASRMVTVADTNSSGPLVAASAVFFYAPVVPAGRSHWNGAQNGNPLPVTCGYDNSNSPNKVAKPDPTMVDRFVIPINCDQNGGDEEGNSNFDCQPYGQVSAVVKTMSIVGSSSGIWTAGAILIVLSTLSLVALRRRKGRL